MVLSGAATRGADTGELVRRGLEERMGVRVEALDFRGAAAMRDRISAGAELLDALAPAVGVVLRERVRLMLRTNLSTRPFYNERAVHVLLGMLAALSCSS